MRVRGVVLGFGVVPPDLVIAVQLTLYCMHGALLLNDVWSGSWERQGCYCCDV